MFIDLDNFKPLNDTHGHKAGDLLLVEVAHRLSKCVREVDTVARFGGDEFLVILPSTHFAGSVTVAERIWREVGEASFAIGDKQNAKVTLSLGVALFPSRDVRSKDALLRAADAALHQAKRDGGNRLCVFQQQGYLYTPMAGSPTLEITTGAGETHVATNAMPQELPVFDPQREAVPTLRPDNASSIIAQNDHVEVEIGVPSLLNLGDVVPETDRRNNS